MVENIKDLKDLKTAIMTINVKDYGDFKRKAVLYINRFVEQGKTSAPQKKAFKAMIDKIQYHPNMDVEKTRNWTLQQLKSL